MILVLQAGERFYKQYEVNIPGEPVKPGTGQSGAGDISRAAVFYVSSRFITETS